LEVSKETLTGNVFVYNKYWNLSQWLSL